jgi:hypothetical protein
MAAPGDPELAADLARRAASVSHDGEAVFAAQVIAAMEAEAFVEKDLGRLLNTAVGLIPRESTIYRLIEDLREQREKENDWHTSRSWLAYRYGYDKFRGNCHVVPNHGLIILSLLYGDDDFQKSLRIVNTSGWDTDCNSGNVGCLMGIKNGLGAIDQGPDWRGPVADRLFLTQAEGGQVISDAVQVAYFIVNCGRALAGEAPLTPKQGARFHFELPGSVQGFGVEYNGAEYSRVEYNGAATNRGDSRQRAPGALKVANVAGRSRLGKRSLAIQYSKLPSGQKVRVSTPTFILPEELNMPGYNLLASPTLYPGQVVQAGLCADQQNRHPVCCGLYCRSYGTKDELQLTCGPEVVLQPGEAKQVEWQVDSPMLAPVAQVGVEVTPQNAGDGVVYLDYLTWKGAPDVDFSRPPVEGTAWSRAWVDAVDRFITHMPESFRLVQNRGTGMLIQGTRDWTDYRVSADVTTNLAASLGIAARVRGLRRYYALILLSDGKARLVKMLDEEIILEERSLPWEFGQTVDLALQVTGSRLQAWVDRQLIFDLTDEAPELASGGIALVVADGCLSCDRVSVRNSDETA